MGKANNNREKVRNLLRHLPWGRQNPRSIPKLDKILFYDGRFSKKRFIKWLAKLETYFYFNKVPCHQKVRLVVNKLSYGAEEWWFKYLNFSAHIGMPLILSWQGLKQSLILELIRDYEDIWYWGHKQINYYYLLYIQPSQKTRKNREKFGESKISMLSNHIEDNVTKRVLTNTFSRLTLN
jgi:hypothetical protein